MNTSNQQRQTIAVTIGDPAGVGAEIVLKAMADPETAQLANWEIVGDEAVPLAGGRTVRNGAARWAQHSNPQSGDA